MHKPPLPSFVSHCGIVYDDTDPEGTGTMVELQPHLLNRSEIAHGGLVATLLDTTMGRVVFRQFGISARIATIEMKVSYMRPGRGTLRARGRCVHRTATLMFCEAEVRDADGLLVATANGTFKHSMRKSGQPEAQGD